MNRIDTDTVAEDLFGAGKHGFKDGDLLAAIIATRLNAEWFNAQQEEKMSVIEGAGVAPAAGNYTQLRQALKRMFGGNVTTVNAGNSPLVLTADNAGLVLMDATAGNVSATLPAANVLTQSLKFHFVRVDATTNTATTTCAGADALVGGGTSFTLTGQADHRAIESDAAAAWATTSQKSAKALGSLTVTHGSNALTCAFPAETLEFRSATLTSGIPVQRNAAAGLLVVPQGATLGLAANRLTRIIWGWIDNAGTPERFVCALAGGMNPDESTLISTTALGVGSDSAGVFYTDVARANVAYRVRGFCDISEAVPGDWATGPTLVQPAGGQALSGLSSFCRDYVDVTGSRTFGVTYYAPDWEIDVLVTASTTTAAGGVVLSSTVNGNAISQFQGLYSGSGGATAIAAIKVSPRRSYSVALSGGGSPTVGTWAEHR